MDANYKKLTSDFDSDYINNTIEEIKKELSRNKTSVPNETYKTKLYLVNDDEFPGVVTQISW